MSRSRVKFNAFALVTATALLIASVGCNPGSITAPDSAPNGVVVTNPDFVRILPSSTNSKADGSTAPATAPMVSRVISAADGGMISNGRVTLFFPAGALDVDTEISMDMLGDGTLGVNFEPHGIQFNRPVIMQTDLRETSAEGMASAVSTVWDNEDAHRYERMESLGASDENTIRCELRHFSKYRSSVDG